jgi:hypothetical protein
VDAIIFVVGSILTEDTEELKGVPLDCIDKLLTQLTAGVSYEDPLSIIQSIKDGVRELQSRVNGFVHSLNRILDEDKNMALMNLSRLATVPPITVYPAGIAGNS